MLLPVNLPYPIREIGTDGEGRGRAGVIRPKRNLIRGKEVRSKYLIRGGLLKFSRSRNPGEFYKSIYHKEKRIDYVEGLLKSISCKLDNGKFLTKIFLYGHRQPANQILSCLLDNLEFT